MGKFNTNLKMNRYVRAQSVISIARRSLLNTSRFDAPSKKIQPKASSIIHLDLPQIKTAEITPKKMRVALNYILENLLVDGRVSVVLKESQKPPGILIDENFLKENLEADVFKNYFRNKTYLKSIGIRRIRLRGESWKRDQRGKLNDFYYQIFIPYKDVSVENRSKLEECLKTAGLLEDSVCEHYEDSEGNQFTKEVLRTALESKSPLELVCQGYPIRGVMDMMKYMRLIGTEFSNKYIDDPSEEIFRPLAALEYAKGELLLDEIAPEESEKREMQDFIGDAIFHKNNYGIIHQFLDFMKIDIKIRIHAAYRNRVQLSELYKENPHKRARRFMAQYSHLVFPNHSLSRFLNQKALLMAELAERNRTDPRGSDPLFWEYERASQSIDYRMKRKPIFEKLDLIVNPAVNQAAIRSFDQIQGDTLAILDEYSDIIERIWDGELFFMNYDMKETVPLIRGVSDKIENGTIDLIVKMVNAVIFQTKLDPLFAADQEATLFHSAKHFIRPKYKTKYLLKYFDYYSIDDVLDEAGLIFTGSEVSNFPEHKCFEAGDSVQERMGRIFDYALNIIMNDAKENPNEKGATYVPSEDVFRQLKVLKEVALPVKRRLHGVDMSVEQYLFFISELLGKHIEEEPEVTLSTLVDYIEQFLDIMPDAVHRFASENSFSGVNMLNKKHFNSKIGNMFTIANSYPLQSLLSNWIGAGGEDEHKTRMDQVLALENQYKLSQIPSTLGKNIESHYSEEPTVKIWNLIKGLRVERAEAELKTWKNYGRVELDLEFLRRVFDPRRKNLKVLHLLQDVGGLSAAEVDYIAKSDVLLTRASKLARPELLESFSSTKSEDFYSRDFNNLMFRSSLPSSASNSLPDVLRELDAAGANSSLRMRRINVYISSLPLSDFASTISVLNPQETVAVLKSVLRGVRIGCADKIAPYWIETTTSHLLDQLDNSLAFDFIENIWEHLENTNYQIPVPLRRPSGESWPQEIVRAWFKAQAEDRIRVLDERDVFLNPSPGSSLLANTVVAMLDQLYEENPTLEDYNFKSYKRKVEERCSPCSDEDVSSCMEILKMKVELTKTRDREIQGRKQIGGIKEETIDDDSMWKMLDELSEEKPEEESDWDIEEDLVPDLKREEQTISIWDEIDAKNREIEEEQAEKESSADLSWDDIDKLFASTK